MLYFILFIGTVVYLLLVIILAIPLASLLATAKALITGRYLNRYYVVSHKGSGVYELHCSPALGYYYTKREKYFAIRADAICKFRRRYPHCTLYSVSSTLKGYYAREGIIGTPVAETRSKRVVGNAMNYLLILRNIANYRKRSNSEWQFAHLIRRVHRAIPQRYYL